MNAHSGMVAFKADYRRLVRSLPATFTLAFGMMMTIRALLAAGDRPGALIAFGVVMTMLSHRFAVAIILHARASYFGRRSGLRVVELRHGLRAYRLVVRSMIRNARQRWLPA